MESATAFNASKNLSSFCKRKRSSLRIFSIWPLKVKYVFWMRTHFPRSMEKQINLRSCKSSRDSGSFRRGKPTKFSSFCIWKIWNFGYCGRCNLRKKVVKLIISSSSSRLSPIFSGTKKHAKEEIRLGPNWLPGPAVCEFAFHWGSRRKRKQKLQIFCRRRRRMTPTGLSKRARRQCTINSINTLLDSWLCRIFCLWGANIFWHLSA